MKLCKILFALILLMLTYACRSAGSSEAVPDTTEVEPTEADLTAPDGNSDAEVRQAVENWRKAHNLRDYALMQQLYADQVKMYGQRLTAAKCVALKREALNKSEEYRLYIDGDIIVENMPDGSMEAYFTKRSEQDSKSHSYEAYLRLRKNSAGQWQIVDESDLTTDRNLKRRAERRAANIPADAVAGDFDGDGTMEHLWVTARLDEDGYAETPFTLRCESTQIPAYSWNSSRGVALCNLGNLGGGKQDYLGAVPYNDSTWCIFYTLVLKDGKWQQAIPSFSVWTGNDNLPLSSFVSRANKPGYVVTMVNDMESEDPFTTEPRLVKLRQ